MLKIVWSMIDGRRSLEDIQGLLTLNPKVVVDAVESLKVFNLIT